MGILRRLREWREGADGTLKGPALKTEQVRNGVAGSNNTISRLFGERIESVTPSGSEAVEFTEVFGTYDTYIIHISDATIASNDQNIRIRVSTDGGSSWESGESAYRWTASNRLDSGAAGTSGSEGDSKIRLNRSDGIGGEDGEGFIGHIQFSRPSSGELYQMFNWHLSTFDNDGTFIRHIGGGAYMTPEAINGVKIDMSDEGFDGGEFDLVGVMF